MPHCFRKIFSFVFLKTQYLRHLFNVLFFSFRFVPTVDANRFQGGQGRMGINMMTTMPSLSSKTDPLSGLCVHCNVCALLSEAHDTTNTYFKCLVISHILPFAMLLKGKTENILGLRSGY